MKFLFFFHLKQRILSSDLKNHWQKHTNERVTDYDANNATNIKVWKGVHICKVESTSATTSASGYGPGWGSPNSLADMDRGVHIRCDTGTNCQSYKEITQITMMRGQYYFNWNLCSLSVCSCLFEDSRVPPLNLYYGISIAEDLHI